MLSNQPQTAEDNAGQETPKATVNKELATLEQQADSLQNKPLEVKASDNPDTIEVTNSDMLDDKQDNKFTEMDTDSNAVVKSAPEAIRSAIVAIVRASNRK